jgi:DNA-binding NarL/FixJ family response regulator
MELDRTNTEILELLSKGLTAKEIAQKVSISIAMVKWRTRELRIATGSKNNVELGIWYNNYQKIADSS